MTGVQTCALPIWFNNDPNPNPYPNPNAYPNPKRACESGEEREIRRLRDREAKRMQRLQESEEQRARRLQRDREAMRQKRANETPEKRQARLIREREAKRLKRRLEKIDPSLRTQIEHDPTAMAALTADMSLFQFPLTASASNKIGRAHV